MTVCLLLLIVNVWRVVSNTHTCGLLNTHPTRNASAHTHATELTGRDLAAGRDGLGGGGDGQSFVFPGPMLLVREERGAQSSQLVQRDYGDGGRRDSATEGRGSYGVNRASGDGGQVE